MPTKGVLANLTVAQAVVALLSALYMGGADSKLPEKLHRSGVIPPIGCFYSSSCCFSGDCAGTTIVAPASREHEKLVAAAKASLALGLTHVAPAYGMVERVRKRSVPTATGMRPDLKPRL